MERRTFLTVLLALLLSLSIASIYVAPAIAAEEEVEIWKEFMDTSDPPPYELRTEYHWDIEIGVWTSVNLRGTRVYDRFSAELKMDSIQIPGKTYTFTYPDYEDKYPTKNAKVTISGEGTHNLDRKGVTFGAEPYKLHIYWSGSSHKIHFEWIIGELKADETITIIVRVSTDLNPGGQQEFTSPCEHCINSGAVVKAKWGSKRISRGTGQLCIKVSCPARLILDKFNDTNRNGIYDAGDVKIANWRIDVTDPYGVTTTYLTPKALEITDFGTYIITEHLPAPWEQTAVRVDSVYQDPPTLTVTVNINTGETHDVLYGNTLPPPLPAKLTLDKFNDTNRNGVYDVGDVKIVDWRIDVTDPHGATTTHLTPKTLEITDFGTYIITEDLPDPWEQTAVRVDGVYIGPPTATVTVDINAGESHDVLYGNMLPRARLIVEKFNDTDGNGVFDGEDVMIAGWEIYVTDPDAVTTTYLTPVSLDITLFGTYTIREDLPDGWEQTALFVDGVAIAPSLEVTVDIDAGEEHRVLYGNHKIPPPPPRIRIGLGLRPSGTIAVCTDVTFRWRIIEDPPDQTIPQKVTLTLTKDGGTPEILYEGFDFPGDFEGEVGWHADEAGDYEVRVRYDYLYLGKAYYASASHGFTVVP